MVLSSCRRRYRRPSRGGGRIGRELSSYRLPEAGGMEAARASLNFLNVGSLKLTIPLLSFAYAAPFTDNHLFKIDFLFWLYGRTGEFKSTIAALLLCHFGPFD